ncbi:NAD+ kinase [Verrucomicrobia bacterium LW23]|nr:NAD+ kinase [Verrucomicrobia bacterium LW23]
MVDHEGIIPTHDPHGTRPDVRDLEAGGAGYPVGPLRVGVIVNTGKDGAKEVVREVQAFADAHPGRIELMLETKTGELIGHNGKNCRKCHDIANDADICLVAGGDGSLLGVARDLYPTKAPILGVNIGSLGFLTSVARGNLEAALQTVLERKWVVSTRIALELTIFRSTQHEFIPCALNDVVVSRGTLSRLVRVRVDFGDHFVTEYNCDGLIVATPTGSTAYSVSAGGPIMAPDAGALAITPICPHTLSNRSLVVGTHAPIRLSLPPQATSLVVQYDGQPGGELRPGDFLEIRLAPEPIRLAFTPGNDFFHLLRQKLKWTGTNLPQSEGEHK